MKFWYVLGLSLLLLAPRWGWAGAVITYHGRILDSDNRPVENANVTFKIRILSPNPGKCLLYEETRTLNMANSQGVFSIPIGDGTGSRTAADPGIAMEKLFANDSAVTFNATNTPKLVCNSGSSYTPQSLDQRQLFVSFDDHSGAGEQELPIMDLNFVPFAVSSYDTQNVGGTPAASILRLSSGSAPPLSPSNLNELMNLINGTSAQFEKPGKLNGASLPVLGNGQVLGWSGGAWTPITPLTSYSETDPSVKNFAKNNLPTCGANAFLKDDGGGNLICASMDVGAGANKIVQLDGAGKLPGLDGSNLTNITASAFSSSGSISTSGNITANTMTAPQINTRNLYIENLTPNRVTIQAPSSFSDYTWILPTAQGTNGQILSMGASGQLQWVSAATGSVTSVAADAPLSVDSSTASSPKVSLPKASSTVDGYLDKADWAVFNSKQSTALPNGNILVGNSSNIATAVAPSGDVSLMNDGTFTVTSWRGNPVVSGTIPAPDVGKVYRWNGTQFVASFLNFGDLKTSVGANQLTASCAANEKIQWSVITDAFTCQTIGSLDASVITTGTISSARLPASASYWSAATGGINYSGGNVGIGATTPSEALTVSGTIYSTSGGIKFPDGTVQTTAATGGGGGSAFESAEISFVSSPSNVISAAHGLGTVPKKVQAVLRCINPEYGYSAGDEVEVTQNGYYNWFYYFTSADATNVTWIMGGTVYVARKDNAGLSGITVTPANWRLVLRAWNTGGVLSGGGSGTTNYIPVWSGSTTLANSPMAINGTKVGIGTASPGVALDVNGAVRAGASTTVTACGAGQANGEGSQRYNYTTHAMEYCNGTSWVALGAAGGSGLGVGQTWQNMTGSRAFGTNYTNSTGKPIQVSAFGSVTGYCGITAVVDGVTVASQWSGASGYTQYSNVVFIVPNGSAYRIENTSGTCGLSNWAELR